MFDTIIKKAQKTITIQKIEDVRKVNHSIKGGNRPRRFVMIAFDNLG